MDKPAQHKRPIMQPGKTLQKNNAWLFLAMGVEPDSSFTNQFCAALTATQSPGRKPANFFKA
jgi:hypothetical protein